MEKHERYGRLYIISFAMAAALAIRAIYLRDSLDQAQPDSIWQTPWFYFLLAGIFAANGLYLIYYRSKKSD